MADDTAQLQLAVLMFTDIVNSVSLQKKLGTAAYTRYIARHDVIFQACLSQVPGARILNETGDGFLVRFNSSSDAVDTALRLQYLLHSEVCEGEPMCLRIGLHSGEITEMHEGIRGETRAVGMAINLAARIMDLAEEGQILMTRTVFDDARQFTRHYPEIEGIAPEDLPPLLWPAYGRYIFKGNDEPMEIYGVGAEGISPLLPPEGSEKAKRAVAADEEATLGWRPGVGLAIPRRDDWVIEKKIGEGGFGEVWLAENKKSRVQRVFKFCFDSDRLRSFRRELTLFRLLRDALGSRRDIAALYEVSVEAPPYYLESEFVPTGNISQWFASKGGIENVPLTTRLQIIAKAARAVAAAHSVGIIHKDIKPSNILISEENGIPEPRLADFGIGTLSDPSRLRAMGITSGGFTESVVLENEGSSSFTHLYAPPEYLVGKPASVRGDIYSLGVMLYQLAVGDLNHPLGTGWRRGIEDELLADDIRRCVDVDPEHRFQSASHLAVHLESLDARHAEKEEELRIEALKRQAERRRRNTLLTLSVVLGLAILAVLLAKGYVDQRAAKEDARYQMSLADAAKIDAEKAVAQLQVQASHSDFLLASQLLERNRRSEALAYLARAVERDPMNHTAGRKLMATLAVSRFVPQKFAPIVTLPAAPGQPMPKDLSRDGTQLAALSLGEQGEEELRVWNLASALGESEVLEWKRVSQTEKVFDLAFASNGMLSFITLDEDHHAVLHVWERSPGWAWLRSDPIGTIRGFGRFVAGGDIWVHQEEPATEPIQHRRRPDLRGGNELSFHTVATGAARNIPGLPGKILAMECSVEGGRPNSAVVVHEMGRKNRFVSVWKPSSESGNSNDSELSQEVGKRPPGRGPQRIGRRRQSGPWRNYSKGDPWSGPPMAIALSPDGAKAAVPEPDGSVQIWSLNESEEEHRLITRIPKANDAVTSLQFTPDSMKLAVGYLGSVAMIYSANSGTKVQGPLPHEGGILGIDFRNDGALVMTSSLDQTARLWDASTGASLSEPMRHDSYVLRSFFSKDGKLAASFGSDGTVKIWDLSGGGAQGESMRAHNRIQFSSISSDWKSVFSVNEVRSPSGFSEFEGAVMNLQRVIEGSPLPPGAPVGGSRFSSDNSSLFVVRADGQLTVRDIATGASEDFEIGPRNEKIQVRAISADGSTVALASRQAGQPSQSNLLSVWRHDGSSYRQLPGVPAGEAVAAVAFNESGSRMVTSNRQQLKVWHLDDSGAYTSKPIATLSITSALAMSSSGDRFLVGAAKGTMQLWSFSGKALTRPLKQSGPVLAVAFAPDGVTAAAASVSLDGRETARVHVWDLASQETLAPSLRFFGNGLSKATPHPTEDRWQSLSGTAATLDFSPECSRILLNFQDDTVVWDLAPTLGGGEVPEVIPRLAKIIGGYELRGNVSEASAMDVFTAVPYTKNEELLRQPPSLTDSLTPWIRWLITPPAERTIAPTSDETNETFTDYLVAQRTVASLREALIRNPNDSRIAMLLATRLMRDDRGERPAKLDEAISLAEWAMDFIQSASLQRRSLSEITQPPAVDQRASASGTDGASYEDIASALTRIGKLHPDNTKKAHLFQNALTAAVLALEENPSSADAWTTVALTLHRMSQLFLADQDETLSGAYRKAAYLASAILSDSGSRDGLKPLEEVLIDRQRRDGAGEPQMSSSREVPRYRRTPRISELLEDETPSTLASAVREIPEIPDWLRQALLFVQSPASNGELNSPGPLWMQRATVQLAMGREDAALDAADRALRDAGADLQAVQRLRARLLSMRGDRDGAREAFAAGNGIAARTAEANPEMIDLSNYFSSGLRRVNPTAIPGGRGPVDQPELAIRPGVLTSLVGVKFDVRGLVFPDDQRPSPRRSMRLPPDTIPVKRTAKRVHFLHAAALPGPSAPEAAVTIGSYVVRYEDNTTVTIPIRLGIEVANWNLSREVAPEYSDGAPVAGWRGESATGGDAVLSVTTWDNPKSASTIASLGFTASAEDRSGRPFLVAITLEP